MASMNKLNQSIPIELKHEELAQFGPQAPLLSLVKEMQWTVIVKTPVLCNQRGYLVAIKKEDVIFQERITKPLKLLTTSE